MTIPAHFLALALCAWLPIAASAAPTDFDPTFNGGAPVRLPAGAVGEIAALADGGIAIFNGNEVVRLDAAGRVSATSARIRPLAGGIVAVGLGPSGTIAALETAGYPSVEAFLARYRPDGVPDSTFGGTGVAPVGSYLRGGPRGPLLLDATGRAYFIAYSSQSSYVEESVRRVGPTATDIATLDSACCTLGQALLFGRPSFTPDGGLLVTRYGIASELAVSRIGPHGGPDLSFGAGGVARVALPGGAFPAHAVSTTDGTVLVVGTVVHREVRQAVVARFLANGTLDSSFGNMGVAVMEVARPGETVDAGRIAVQSDGRIVVAVNLVTEPSPRRPFSRGVVARMHADGTPDATFAPAGFATFWWQYGTSLDYLDVLGDGRIVLGGSVWTSAPPDHLVTKDALLFRLKGGADTTLRPLREALAVEYFHAGQGHYFVTTDAQEMSVLDTTPGMGWSRTGRAFRVWDENDGTMKPVCRFWSDQTFAPKSSHFYTPYDQECALLQAGTAWRFERHAFVVRLPEGASGAKQCGTGSQPLYRAYNAGVTGAPNHRYTTDPTLLDQLVAQGWIMEGEAATRVFACVPLQ